MHSQSIETKAMKQAEIFYSRSFRPLVALLNSLKSARFGDS